jgi:hypothetical protein
LVTIRVLRPLRNDEIELVLIAFELDDGRPRWQTRLEIVDRDFTDTGPLHRIPAVGAILEIVDLHGGELVTIAPATGAVLARERLGNLPSNPMLFGGKSVMFAGERIHMFEHGHHSAVATYPASGCGSRHELFWFAHEQPSATTTVLHAAPDADVGRPRRMELETGEQTHRLGCTTYRDAPVLAETFGVAPSRLVFADVEPRTLDLGGAISPVPHPALETRTPRFVVYPVSRGYDYELILVDQELRRVVWREPVGVPRDVYQVDGYWYVRVDEMLAVIDGRTGRRRAARRVGGLDVDFWQVSGGVVWLTSGYWAPWASLPR